MNTVYLTGQDPMDKVKELLLSMERDLEEAYFEPDRIKSQLHISMALDKLDDMLSEILADDELALRND